MAKLDVLSKLLRPRFDTRFYWSPLPPEKTQVVTSWTREGVPIVDQFQLSRVVPRAAWNLFWAFALRIMPDEHDRIVVLDTNKAYALACGELALEPVEDFESVAQAMNELPAVTVVDLVAPLICDRIAGASYEIGDALRRVENLANSHARRAT